MIAAYALWLLALAKRVGIGLALILDCIGSVLVGESFNATLSAKAWDSRNHRWWHWCHRFIDGLPIIGGPNHCQNAAIRESENGGAWPGWWKKTKRVWGERPVKELS